LDDATASLLSRDATVAALESQAIEAKAALDVALGELEAKRNALEQLEQVRTETGLKLEQVQNSLHDLRVERENDDSASMLAIAQTEVIVKHFYSLLRSTYPNSSISSKWLMSPF
jgi:sensor histidine kinase YesM